MVKRANREALRNRPSARLHLHQVRPQCDIPQTAASATSSLRRPSLSAFVPRHLHRCRLRCFFCAHHAPLRLLAAATLPYGPWGYLLIIPVQDLCFVIIKLQYRVLPSSHRTTMHVPPCCWRCSGMYLRHFGRKLLYHRCNPSQGGIQAPESLHKHPLLCLFDPDAQFLILACNTVVLIPNAFLLPLHHSLAVLSS